MSRAGLEDVLPLTPLQEGMFFHAAFDADGRDVYTVQLRFELAGQVDAAALRAAAQGLLDRHANLRVAITATGVEKPVQLVMRRVAVPFTELEVAGRAEAERIAEADRRARFDLETPPLIRFTLLHLGPDEHLLLLTHHHLLLDGWSGPLLGRDLFALYGSRGDPAALPRVRPFRDHLAWLARRDHAAARDAWAKALSGVDGPTLVAPAGTGSAPARPERVRQALSARDTARVTGFAREHGVTLNTLVQAAWALVLGRRTGRGDVVFGGTVHGRPEDLPGAREMIGLFINTVPVRVALRPAETVGAFLRRIQAEQARLLDHQHLGLAEIQRLAGGGDLFDSLVVVESYPVDERALTEQQQAAGLTVTAVSTKDAVHYPASLIVVPGDRLELACGYRADLNPPAWARRLLDAATRALLELTADAGRPVGRLPLLDAALSARVLREWNDTARELPPVTLPELFAEQVRRAPDAPAVLAEDTRWSFAEFDERIARFAGALRAEGVRAGDIVAVALPRSAELVAVLYAIHRLGAAYLPIDPGYPAERVDFMIADARPALLITAEKLAALRAGTAGPVTAAAAITPGHTAYVIYTSGSTGRPKGVAVPHAAIVNRLRWMRDAYAPAADDRMLLKTPISFDVSVPELFWPLATSRALVVARPDGHRDPAYLAALAAREAVTILHFVPSMLGAFLAEPAARELPSVRLLLCSGEALPAELLTRAREILPSARLLNLYGPTEAAVEVSAWDTTGEDATRPVPIGRPLWNTRWYVLDAALRPLAPGEPGELYLAGAQLASGYLGRRGLTAERFVADPFGGPGDRMYRTGDLASWNPDGTVAYLGRIDHQVKVRGFRVELGEIEHALRAMPGVGEATVVARPAPDGTQVLIGYVTPATADVAATRTALAERLPEHLVPQAIVALAEFPVTANGKLDRAALPEPARAAGEVHRDSRTVTEQLVTELFAEVLGVPKVGLDDNFFALGGHSLLAIKLVGVLRTALGAELTPRTVFEHTTPAALAAALDTAGPARPAITAGPRPERVPLSASQRQLWFFAELDGPSPTYNLPLVWRISGPLEVDALRAALADLTARHEILRTVFEQHDGNPYQRVLDTTEVACPVAEVTEAGLADRLTAAVTHPFRLDREPPLRATLFRLGDREHVLVLLLHHIAGDEWSANPLRRDLFTAYRARLRGAAPDRPPLPVQYADFALWQAEQLAGSLIKDQVEFWLDELADLPECLDLPLDRPRPPVAGQDGDAVEFTVPPQVAERLRALGAECGATQFMLAQAAVATLLHRLGAGTDIPLGTQVAGRGDPALDEVAGFFTNTVVLRTDLRGRPAFRELVDRVRTADLAAFAHQDLPFDRLVDRLRPRRSLAHHPLFQVGIAYQHADFEPEAHGELTVAPQRVHFPVAKFDLDFEFVNLGPGDVRGAVLYRTDLFDRSTAERIAALLVRLLTELVARPDRPVTAADLLTGDERRLLLDRGRAEPAADRRGIAGLFAEAVVRDPGAEAVRTDRRSLTYAELDAESDRLAGRLAACGAGPERTVLVLLGRGAEAVVAFLAVAKAGAVFVPVAPGTPPARLAELTAATGPVAAVAEPGAHVPDGVPVLHPGEDSEAAPVPGPARTGGAAYLIHTSGSTGRPKGVLVSQAAIGALVHTAVHTYGAGPGARVLQFTTPAFDVFAEELAMSVLSGGTLCIPGEEERLGAGLAAYAARHDLTHVDLPPAALDSLPPRGLPAGTTIVVGSDRVPAELLARWAPGRRVCNAYGPTETTVNATVWTCPAEFTGRVLIGRPDTGRVVYVLDTALNPVPAGVPGELYVAGDALARGYWRAPAATAERFVADPFGKPGTRMYRTGDRVRWADGDLEFLGRIDDQLKIRGFRIEPAEVEAALAQRPQIAAAAAVARRDGGEPRLVAYVVPAAGQRLEPGQLRRGLAAVLPDYLVPSAVVVLDTLPVNASGKVDRRELSTADWAAPEPDADTGAEPGTAAERAVAEAFRQVLGLDTIGTGAGFFALGGDSISSIQVVSRLRAAGWRVTARQVFERQTVAELAAVAVRDEPATGAEVALTEGAWPLSPLQEGLFFLTELGEAAVYTVQQVFELTGELDTGLLRRCLHAVLDRYPNLRAGFAQHDAGRPVQFIPERAEVPWRNLNLSTMDSVAAEAECARLIAEDREAPFDPAAPPLLRALVVHRPDGGHRFVLTHHHLLMDGWSGPLFGRELFTLYGNGGNPAALPAAADYREYLRRLAGRDAEAELRAWRTALSEVDTATLVAPGATPAGLPEDLRVPLPVVASRALAALAREQGLTLNTVVQAAWALTLAAWTGRTDVVFGATVHGRPGDLDGADRMIGLFINTVPVRVRFRPAETGAELLGRIQAEQARLLEHHQIGLAEIQRALGTGELFDSLLVFESYPVDEVALAEAERVAGLTVTGVSERDATHYPVTLLAAPADGLRLTLRHRPGSLDSAAAARLAGVLTRAIAWLIGNPATPLARADLLTGGERDRVLRHWNDTAHPVPETTLPDLFAAQVARTPDGIALSEHGRELTYAELDARVNALTTALRARGAGPGAVVAVRLPRSADLVAVLHAVHRCGAAYLPVDPGLPAGRAEFLLADAEPSLLVTPEFVSSVDGPVGPEPVAAGPGDAAYVLYTSGSTGRPKGVVVEHAAIVNRLLWMADEYGFAPGEKTLQKTPASFDVSVWEFFLPLLTGGTLVLAEPGGHRDPAYLARVIREERIGTIHFVPSMLAAFLAEPAAAKCAGVLRRVLCSGEELPAELAIRAREVLGVAVHNLYGPTEAAVDVTAWDTAEENGSRPVPIGRPVWNTRAYVLDAALRPVAPGVPGELYLAGAQLARGYLRRAGLTAERFVADPFGAPGDRMYRTGDLASWLGDGTLAYHGRTDDQVKLRGQRIELGEIDHALRGVPGVIGAASRVHTGQAGPVLAGYVTGDVEPEAVLAAVRETLPETFVPATVLVLPALPLTPSGKLDRAGLPAPDFAAATGKLAPSGPVETALTEAFAAVLGLESVGAGDDFFALGGDSISSLQLIARLRKAGYRVTPRQVFERRTPAALAPLAEPDRPIVSVGGLAPDGSGIVPLLPVMESLRALGGDTRRFSQSMLVTVPAGATFAELTTLLGALLDTHDALRATLEPEWVYRIRPRGAVVAADLLRRVEEPVVPERIRAEFAAELAELDPAAGRMLRAVWFDGGPDRPGRLLLVAHHLVIDGVSWRILLDDLAEGWTQLRAGRPVALAPEATSLPAWSAALRERTGAGPEAWAEVLRGSPALGAERALDPARDTRSTVDTHELVLPAELTEPLLARVPAAARAGVQEVLLAGLALAAARWRAERGLADTGGLLLDLEGHGRDEHLVPGTDLSRTVGWFTTVYPARVGGVTGEPIDWLKAVKEQLRALPDALDRGFTPREETPSILFNYLGRLGSADGTTAWAPAPESAALDGSADRLTPVSHPLEINAVTVRHPEGPRLHGEFAFARGIFAADDVRSLAREWQAALTELAAAVNKASALTPSDFPLAALTQSDVDELADSEPADVLPLSPLQEGLFFRAAFDEVDVYTVAQVYELSGPVEPDRFRAAGNALLVRHANLRASFRQLRSGAAVQVVPVSAELPWRFADLSGRPEAELERETAEAATARFDLGCGPLLRLTLLRIGANRHRLVLGYHHILADGWSGPLLADELFTLYGTRADPSALPPVRPYADHLAWLARQDTAAAERAWRAALSGVDGPTRLAPAVAGTARPERITSELPAAVTARLSALARTEGMTLSTLISTAWAVVLGELTGRADVVFGTTVHGRPAELPGADRMIGLFINTIPVRIRLDLGETPGQLLRRVHAEQARLLDHQHTGLARIQRWAGTGELFDTLLVFESYPVDQDGLDRAEAAAGLVVESVTGADATHYPLTVVAVPGERLTLGADFRPDAVDRASARAALERLSGVLAEFARDPALPLGRLPLPGGESPTESFGAAREIEPATLPDLFAAQVARTPDAEAITTADRSLSYAEFDALVARLAAGLADRGAGPGTLVGVALDRSIELVAVLHAVHRCGAAYVPIDPGYPAARREYLTADAAPAVLVTPELLATLLAGTGALAAVSVPDTAPAYVIHTSGSTGQPKGVVVDHRAIVNRLRWMAAEYGFGPDDRTLQKTPISFDVSVWELFLPLLTGGTLVVAEPGGHRDPAYLAGLIRDQRITAVHFVPSMLRPFLAEPAAAGLAPRRVFCSGEALTGELVRTARSVLPGAELHNLYGPTEAAVDVTGHDTRSGDPGAAIPLGRPVWNTGVHVLDRALRPVPHGRTGEIHLSGVQLARGYLNRPGLTATRFVANPFGPPGSRLYRTGDLGRRRADGVLEYLGRTDDQVKIRGLRVELGEVAAALASLPGVTGAEVVADGGPAGTRLIAYLTGQRRSATELRAELGERLPEHLLPAAFTWLAEFPLTPNGKLDRAALPRPDAGAESGAVAPRTDTEQLLATCAADVLGLDRIGVLDDFFALGGDSILALHLVGRARAEGLRLTPRQVFELRTIAALAETAVPVGPDQPAAPETPLLDLDDDEFAELAGDWSDA
ncbi:non-ribosomal peptide synthetase [Amycolatopsis anabasis]|uniref:non-ribosomal peptide synthetase n=1 Tax=Amycolatopsis anabasis TaxID=1840409 RepID=UPI00131DD294|nr:non-ribosomal peptide synthetase [Amycolatopsis anabasis]